MNWTMFKLGLIVFLSGVAIASYFGIRCRYDYIINNDIRYRQEGEVYIGCIAGLLAGAGMALQITSSGIIQ